MSVLSPVRVAALLTCFNRRELTVRAIGSLMDSAPEGVAVEVTVVDDGSSDGTTEAIHAMFPSVRVVPGSGELYWSGGMSLAQQIAMESSPDYLLWLNDDVDLLDSALRHLLDTSREFGDSAIVVGAVTSATGDVTYSGYRRPGRRPQRLVAVEPGPVPTPMDTMNGNCVLIPRAVAERVGPIDSGYTHRFGDLDYGYRAKNAGIRVMLASGSVGTCEANTAPAPHLAPGLTLRQRLAIQTGPIYLPIRDQLRFSRRHAGSLWPLATASPYLNTVKWHFAGR